MPRHAHAPGGIAAKRPRQSGTTLGSERYWPMTRHRQTASARAVLSVRMRARPKMARLRRSLSSPHRLLSGYGSPCSFYQRLTETSTVSLTILPTPRVHTSLRTLLRKNLQSVEEMLCVHLPQPLLRCPLSGSRRGLLLAVGRLSRWTRLPPPYLYRTGRALRAAEVLRCSWPWPDHGVVRLRPCWVVST